MTPQQAAANSKFDCFFIFSISYILLISDGETDPFYGADENNLVVLDPNHELMKRFQKRLKKHLISREEKLTLETREAKYELDVRFTKKF